MRILIISNYYPPIELGGWEQLTGEVAGLLQARGHTVWVLTSNYRANEVPVQPGVERRLHLESPDHVRYHLRYTLAIGRWERRNRRIISSCVATFRPDLIFINGMWNLPHHVADEAERCMPGRVIYYVASPWPAELDAHHAYWSQQAARRWLQMPKQLVGAAVRRYLLPAVPRNRLAFEHVLFVSAFMQQQLAREAGVVPRHSHVVYNGIDLNAFPLKRARNDHRGTLRLLYAGRLSPDKGVHTAVAGVAAFRARFPDAPVRLTLVGGGADSYRNALQHQVAAMGLTGVVQFQGQVPRESMPEILADHDVLLFPSIWDEPLARIVQEAMACGLVVIGTTTGGMPEILRHGENGLTFEAGNAGTLANRIAELYRHPELAIRLAHQARRTVEQMYTIDRMVDELEGHFNKLIGCVPERQERIGDPL